MQYGLETCGISRDCGKRIGARLQKRDEYESAITGFERISTVKESRHFRARIKVLKSTAQFFGYRSLGPCAGAHPDSQIRSVPRA
jgi:hypothetical protein